MYCIICGTRDRRLRYHPIYPNNRICSRCVPEQDLTRCHSCGIGVFLSDAHRVQKGIGDITETCCPNCYETKTFTCDNCGRVEMNHSSPAVYDSDGNEYRYCSICSPHFVQRCSGCNDIFLRSEMGSESLSVCRGCRPFMVENCDVCGNDHNMRHSHQITTDTGPSSICRSCLERSIGRGNVFECSICHGFFGRGMLSHRIEIGGTVGIVCSGCIENVNRCTICGRNVIDGEMCNRCRRNLIKNHYYQPESFHFFRASPLDEDIYLGIELEMSCMDQDRVIPAYYLLHELSDNESLFYIKHDGSVDNGWEIVSYPATLNHHKFEFPWPKICKRAAELGCRSHNTNTCGLHVHITNRLSYTQAIQFGTFIYNNRSLNEIVARRGGTDYSRYKKADRIKYGKELKELPYSDDRYEAVNYTNNNTLELRIFRGTLKLETLFACMEYTHAVYKFTMVNSIQKCVSNKSMDLFLKFIMNNHKEYENLYHYLKDRDVI